jgi:putative hemolysin
MIELAITFSIIVVISGVLSLFETSIVAANPIKLKLLVGKRKCLNIVEKKTDDVGLAYFTISMLFDVNGVNWCAMLASDLFQNGTFYIYTLVVTSSLLYFSTLIPKMLGTKYSEAVLSRCACLIVFIYHITRPVTYILALPLKFLFKSSGESAFSITEVTSVVSAAKSLGVIDSAEQTLVDNILTKMKVGDLMRCASEIDSIDIDTRIGEHEDVILNGVHKRYVVTRRKKSTIEAVGVVLYRDLAQSWLCGNKDIEVSSLMHDVCIVKADEPAIKLLLKLNQNEDHLAVVINASGILLGVLSADDILSHLFVRHK